MVVPFFFLVRFGTILKIDTPVSNAFRKSSEETSVVASIPSFTELTLILVVPRRNAILAIPQPPLLLCTGRPSLCVPATVKRASFMTCPVIPIPSSATEMVRLSRSTTISICPRLPLFVSCMVLTASQAFCNSSFMEMLTTPFSYILTLCVSTKSNTSASIVPAITSRAASSSGVGRSGAIEKRGSAMSNSSLKGDLICFFSKAT